MIRRYFIVLWFGMYAAGVSAEDAQPLPVQVFFSYPQISEVKISPDGKYLALAVANDATGLEKSTLLVLRLADRKPTARFVASHYIPTEQQSIYGFWWVNDERLLIASQTQAWGLDVPRPDGRLFAMNADSSQFKELISATMDAYDVPLSAAISRKDTRNYFRRLIAIPPNDPRHVLIETYAVVITSDGEAYVDRHAHNQAYILDVYTGGLQLAATSPTAEGDLLADSKGEVRLAEGSNADTGASEFFYRTGQNGSDWKDMSSLLANDDPADTPLGTEGFTGDDQKFYWKGRTPTSTLGLYAIDPANLHREPLFADPDNDISGLIWSLDYSLPQHVVAVETMPGLPAVRVLDPADPEAQILAQLYQAYPDQSISITSNTRDGLKMIVRLVSDRNPGEYYLFDAHTRQLELLFKSKPEIEPSAMAAMRPITFKARDGLTLHGYLTSPRGMPAKMLPAILMVHGGPHGMRDRWGWNPEAQFFANHGYAVLQANYRGSGGYGMKFQDLGYRHWGTSMQDDLADTVRWAVDQGIADPHRICIYGASYGGYAAVENAILYPELYRCSVGYVGVYDLTLQANYGDTQEFASGRNYLEVVHGNNVEELKNCSPVYNADKIRVPLFIAYGGADVRVVPKNAEELMSALDKAGKPYEKLYERFEGHGFIKPEHNYELYTRMLAFFDKYIGADVSRAATAAPVVVTRKQP